VGIRGLGQGVAQSVVEGVVDQPAARPDPDRAVGTIQLPLAQGLALLLNQKLRGRGVFRLLFFAPFVLSEVITGVLFTMIFSPPSGLANHLLGAVGLESVASTWPADTSIVLYSLFFVSLFFVMTWKYFGFHMILYLAGRQTSRTS
jgi:raffinose/stachyose/melibiose transport system permease protein